MKTNMHLRLHLAKFFLKTELFQAKVVENIRKHFIFSNFFFPENRTVDERKGKNILQPGRPQMTIRRMHIA